MVWNFKKPKFQPLKIVRSYREAIFLLLNSFAPCPCGDGIFAYIENKGKKSQFAAEAGGKRIILLKLLGLSMFLKLTAYAFAFAALWFFLP